MLEMWCDVCKTSGGGSRVDPVTVAGEDRFMCYDCITSAGLVRDWDADYPDHDYLARVAGPTLSEAERAVRKLSRCADLPALAGDRVCTLEWVVTKHAPEDETQEAWSELLEAELDPERLPLGGTIKTNDAGGVTEEQVRTHVDAAFDEHDDRHRDDDTQATYIAPRAYRRTRAAELHEQMQRLARDYDAVSEVDESVAALLGLFTAFRSANDGNSFVDCVADLAPAIFQLADLVHLDEDNAGSDLRARAVYTRACAHIETTSRKRKREDS